MTEDARFEDGRDAPLNLGAFDDDDLRVISSLAQDAVFPITEMTWRPRERRFALLVNRFRWEDTRRGEGTPERVQSVLLVDNVLSVASHGIDRNDTDTILSLLTVTFEPEDECGGHVLLTLAGDGAIRLNVEALEVGLRDVTRPYRAPSGRAPSHDDDS
ncbi:DUF2948 family protein [Roseovarius sp. SYSU LYC5161]|jgi:hypothetical protein|uniref:DUF2948 family protein n=1 Tax=Roseovarius halophilus (ex Wu et al. 2025) TaxID=3376060 RepID=UPI002871CF2E|nr:DUF2948 family protein [Roseovarius sp.]